ncbi:MAG: hypothetical protein PHO66_04050, partial [Eubacteriales bacterium]|nr:hypothetical protein [Eubacteriales bacterium]
CTGIVAALTRTPLFLDGGEKSVLAACVVLFGLNLIMNGIFQLVLTVWGVSDAVLPLGAMLPTLGSLFLGELWRPLGYLLPGNWGMFFRSDIGWRYYLQNNDISNDTLEALGLLGVTGTNLYLCLALIGCTLAALYLAGLFRLNRYGIDPVLKMK